MNKKPEPNWAFKMMALIHNSPIRRIFIDPYRVLKSAGLRSGQRVMEVGCGPGFFTIPAAKIVGEKGIVYAIDIYPLAIKTVQEKIRKERMTNVKTILADASQTRLPDQSIDLAFLFGIVHRIDENLECILDELYRILKSDGIISIEKSPSSKKKLVEAVERKGYIYSGNKGGIFLFTKKNRENKSNPVR